VPIAFKLAPLLQAAVVVTPESRVGAGSVFSVSSADLLQSSTVTSAGLVAVFSSAPTELIDGEFGASGESGFGESVAPFDSNSSVTFTLDLAVSPAGYSLTRLDSYASWNSGRDGQEFTVAYSTVTAPDTFIPLVTIPQFNPPGSGNHFHTLASLTDSGGLLAIGVAKVRYTFTEFENSGTAYREIDAFGTATVPEPCEWCLLGVTGLVGFAVLRRWQ
jgi:hypothetical protein